MKNVKKQEIKAILTELYKGKRFIANLTCWLKTIFSKYFARFIGL